MMLFGHMILTSTAEFLRRKSGVVLCRLESRRTKEAFRAVTSPLSIHIPLARDN